MSTPSDSSSPSADSASASALTAEVLSLRMLLSGLITTVLVATIGVNILLFKQMRLIRQANAQAALQLDAGVKAFNEGEAVQTKALINQLVVFAKTNPDFAEILNKYLQPQAGTTTGAPVVTPAAPGK
jgi:hypothetical protein